MNQLVYNSSASIGDVTNLSLFGMSNLAEANAFAGNPDLMAQTDASGYIGSATVVTSPGHTAATPAQATPDSIVAAADSLVGQAWNSDGCWVLASTISAEAGASLPVQSTLVGLPGQANGEWVVAFNGPAGQSGNWQSMVTAGDMIVFETASGGGHITTCVSGSGSTAMLVDNITYLGSGGQIINSANDGSSADVLISAPHLASQEFAGVPTSMVVIYELDTPIVTAAVTSDSLACYASQSLGSLFSATDPASMAITSWQVYDMATGDDLVLNGVDYSDHSASDALNAASLAAISLLAGSAPTTDTLEVRAFNGSYWGDWTSLSVAITAATVTLSPPVLESQTSSQTWIGGKAVSLVLPVGTFKDPQGESLSYTATLSNGQALPNWLTFNAATDTFTGTAPLTAETLGITVTATDSSGLSIADTFSTTVIGPPTLATQTANQTWIGGRSVSLVLPAGTFEDPQGEAVACSATLSNGQALPGWLTFNATTDTFTGAAPLTAETLGITVTATDSSGLSIADTFSATVIGPPALTVQTANQTWTEGTKLSLALAANAFTDPQGERLTYSATLSNGQALPSWLIFNAATDSFSGTAPATAQTVDIVVAATDSSGLSASDSFAVTIAAAAIVETGPKLTGQTSGQTWKEGQAVSLALPAGTFTDPAGETLTYTATLSSGQALPGWLKFNAVTDSFSGTPPNTAQTLSIKVTATDTSGLSVAETFVATVLGAPEVTAQTPGQSWAEGKAFSLTLPVNTFTDPQGQHLTYTATQQNGQALPSWLQFNATTDTFSGTAPGTAQTVAIQVSATDTSGLTVSEGFTATVAPVKPAITVTAPTPNQTWVDGETVGVTLPASTFTDALGLKMTFAAYELSGPNVTSWLYFNPNTDELFGVVPKSATGTVQLAVLASDSQHMTAEDVFSVTFAPNPSSHLTAGVVATSGLVLPPDPSQVAGFIVSNT